MMNQFLKTKGFLFFCMILKAIIATYITFDSGDEMRYDYFYLNQYNGFTCQWGGSFTNTTTFQGDGFANIPKVIISNFFYNMVSNANSEFSFNITQITKTSNSNTLLGFTTSIFCPSNRFYGFTFTWAAIDDQRIEVINVFNQSMINKGTQTFTFPHYNVNVNQAFVSFISFGFSGNIDYNLKVKQVTSNKVDIDFTTSTTNLLQLGYQIILGTSQAFTLGTPITFQVPYGGSYDTGFIAIAVTEFLILPYAGINYENKYNLRQMRNIIVSNSTGKQYQYICWDYASHVQYTFTKVLLKYSITQIFSPFICQKMRTLKQLNPYAQSNPQMILTINELSLTQSNTFSHDYYFLNNTYQTLNLVITYQCNLGQIIQGQVLKCFQCLDSYWNINQYCYRRINQVIYYVRLKQKDLVNQNITLSVNSRGFTITQKVQNQINSTETVITMQIIN